MSPPVLGATRPLAPQPVRSADAPVLQPLHNSYPLKSTRSRRGTINAACRECRLKKLKRCLVKGIDSCEYTVNPGETRFTALKRKNASLVTEADRMHRFIEALRSASPSQAQEMLSHLRTADDLSQLSTPTLSQPDPHAQPFDRHDSDSSMSSGPSPPSNADTAHTPHTSRSRKAQADKQALRVAACELCAVAAIGSQYIKESLPEGIQQNVYSAAKHLLEDTLTFDANRAAKTCVMLCLYNVMSKQKVAMTFVVCPPNMERRQWTELRKTWRVLVFLETWLSSTLGYVSGLQLPKELMNVKNLEIEYEATLEEKVTTEMVKITVIKFDMLRLSLSFKSLSALMIGTITNELQHWYRSLPHEMRLAGLADNSEVSFELRRTIYYVKFLYFGAQIMLLRRVLQSMYEQSNLLAGDEAVVNDLIAQANFAARESAKLFKLMLVEGRIVKKCWAYSSCVMILHNAAEMLFEQHMEGRPVSRLQDDLHLALACLDFLQVCSQKDLAAGQFYSTLSRFYTTMYSTASGQLEFGPDMVNTARDLNELTRRPFKTPSQASPEFCYLWQEEDQENAQRQQYINDLMIRDVANAPDESLCCDSWQRIDGIKNDGMIHDLLSGIRPGRFLPGFESSNWT
ncbi:unnamed protein product, partial [Aureobasidium uvarum]